MMGVPGLVWLVRAVLMLVGYVWCVLDLGRARCVLVPPRQEGEGRLSIGLVRAVYVLRTSSKSLIVVVARPWHPQCACVHGGHNSVGLGLT